MEKVPSPWERLCYKYLLRFFNSAGMVFILRTFIGDIPVIIDPDQQEVSSIVLQPCKASTHSSPFVDALNSSMISRFGINTSL